MTSSQEVAYRYSSAYFARAKSENILNDAFQELKSIEAIFASNKKLFRFFNNPTIKIADKRDLITDLMKSIKGSTSVQSLFDILLENGRLSLINDIFITFDKLYKEELGEIEVEIISAIDLSSEQLRKIEKSLHQSMKTTVTIKTKTDPKILGGMIFKHGSQMVDGSLKTQLDNIRLKLKEI